MLLHHLVAGAAVEAPDRPALVVGDEVTTFAELDRRVTSLAAALRGRTTPGDRIAFVADNGPEWIDAYYGVPRAGCLLGFVNHRLGPRPMAEAIDRLRPSVLVAGRAQLESLPELASDPTLVVLDEEGSRGDGAQPYADLLAQGAEGEAPDDELRPDATAWLIATSGTSGTPKVVQLSHANLLAAVAGTLVTRPVADDDVYLFPFPLCHVAGYNVLAFHGRARPVVISSFQPQAFVEQVARHRITAVSLAPTMIHALVEQAEAGGPVPSSLRTVSYGSSGIAPHLLARAMDLLGAGFQQGYGMTELAGNAVFLSAEDHRRGLDDRPELLEAAGRPGPNVEVVLLDDDGGEVPTGEVGEIAVRGEQVTTGYWEAPEATAAAFEGDWLRTGDLGRFDDDGYLSVVDRKKDIIVSGGENVSSRAVEDALAAHPEVAEVAVVGAPDDRWGEVVCAVVVPRAGAALTEDDVLAFGREAIGGFQQPRRVVLVEALPRTTTGKVQKHELRDRVLSPPT